MNPTAYINFLEYLEGTTGLPKMGTLTVHVPKHDGTGTDIPALLTLWDTFRNAVIAVTDGAVHEYEAYSVRVEPNPRNTSATSASSKVYKKWLVAGHANIVDPDGNPNGTKRVSFTIPTALYTDATVGVDRGMEPAFRDPLLASANALIRSKEGFVCVFTDVVQHTSGGKSNLYV